MTIFFFLFPKIKQCLFSFNDLFFSHLNRTTHSNIDVKLKSNINLSKICYTCSIFPKQVKKIFNHLHSNKILDIGKKKETFSMHFNRNMFEIKFECSFMNIFNLKNHLMFLIYFSLDKILYCLDF